MTLIELRTMKELHSRELKRLESIRIQCGTCEEYTDRRCQKWGMLPPPEVLPIGCDAWVYDFIPF